MLGKSKNTTIIFCINIVILFILCAIVVLINFFTKDSITKEVIVGINPISLTKSITSYQEPLMIILENKEKKVVTHLEAEEDIKNIEKKVEVQEIEEENQEYVEIEVENNFEKNNSIEVEQEKKHAEDNENEIAIELEGKEREQSEELERSVLTEYKGFTIAGKIEIPQTGVDIPILNQVTVEGMKNAPCLLYSTGELNQNGNNLIVGHNFRNGTIFSDNKSLKLGDKIYVTTLDGSRVEYTIYNKFVTTAEDVSYIKRDTNNKPEITLSCCTDDDEYRIIILAKI